MRRSRRASRAASVETRSSGSRLPSDDLVEQLLERDASLAVERRGLDELGLGDADGVDEHEAVLGVRVGRDGLEVVWVDDAHAAALHLLEEVAAPDRAHEQHALERLHVGAGGDHVDGHGDARVVAGAERCEQVLGLAPSVAL